VLSGVNPKVHAVLEKAHFYDIIGEDHICPHIDIALEKAKELANA
jgi:SulP family sulfate permease